MPKIVTMNVTQTTPPTPNNLQQMGAVISQGGTTLASGTSSLLTSDSSLTPLLAATLSLTSLAWSSGTVVATSSAAIPGLTTGDTFITTIAGATPTGYNGTYLATVTGTNTFTFALATNPGSETVAGTYTPPNQNELVAMVDEIYTQGASQAVYVLELGAGDGASGPTALSTWIADNPGVFYAYLVPRIWDAEANFITLLKAWTATTAKTYFFVTTTTENYTQYAATKSAVPFVEAPGANATLDSFDCASLFQMWLYGSPNGPPSSASLQGTYNQRFSYGTTAWPPTANAATLAALDAAKINYIGTGAQGGIATNVIENGYTGDAKPMQYWWNADWIQINIPLNLSNAIINAANNGAPLDYDQSGIDTLQKNAEGTFDTASSYNLINGTISGTDLTGTQFAANFENGNYNGMNVINAIPFATYVAQNPSAYADQQYGGFSAVVTPMLGFASIIFNLALTEFA